MTETKSSAPPPDLLAAMQRMRLADNRGALELAEAAVATAKDRAPYLALASLAALRLEEPARAIPHLRALLALNPNDRASRANLANALVETGDMDGAIALIGGAAEPNLARIEGYARQQRGDIEGAIAAYLRALAGDGADLASLNNLGNLYAACGKYDEAIGYFERAITLAPREIDIYLNLAEVLRQADRGRERLKVMRDAQVIAPGNRKVLTELALAHVHADGSAPSTSIDSKDGIDGIETAIAILEDVVARFPEFGESHIELGRLYEALNRVDDLAALINRIDGVNAPPEAAFLLAWQAQREGRFDDAAELARGIPETVHPMRRLHLIGAIADRRDDTAAAFAAFERMNEAAVTDSAPVQGPTFRETVERNAERWTRDWFESWTEVDLAGEQQDPVFLVGFPRSGTTLLDTMLMGQPELSVLEERPILASVANALGGEDLATLSLDRTKELRSQYFATARTCGWDESLRLVDKHPLNMTRLPLIHRLFPNAKIVLAERHPYDVVLSCFIANFQQNFAMRSFTSLEESARTYDAVFSAWERARSLCDADIRPIRYERLLDNTRDELEPLIRWLGLEFNERSLAHEEIAKARGLVRTASYSQIVERLYIRARDRWRRYADHLTPVIPILHPWAERMGYATE
ncbi:tetratricopeptide repeat-containing sulfotransferase family protein [Pelagerythrobacter aerophilus]|uniref:Sulfotransferase family protein n=1 Tax=Pelagerythrobacter aerophilus TaxID=2306995 RepID=A0A418NHC7_9SPHN|nr:sulfotransferase [Pelagerythrobacter aerophilus]RIV78006.1 sulfotransferase family protein [Pelagerythrobacter aerophilus]